MQLACLCGTYGLARASQPSALSSHALKPRLSAALAAPRRRQLGRRALQAVAAAGGTDPAAAAAEAEAADEGGLLPEEDVEIPGNYRDAMTTNTPLGKAVKGACDELDTLGDLERQTLEEAEGLLKKLGFKGSLFAAAQQQEAEQQQQGGQAAAGGDS